MVRFGIVGTNFISDWFAEAVTIRSDATVAAVYSRTAESGEEFAHRHGIPMATTRYEALLDAVDAVYLASPIIAHHPQALAALAAGRHVLVEKTMAGSAAQIAEIQDAAAASGLIAMEAVRSLYTPAFAAIRAGVDRLGAIRQASFSKQQYSSRYDAFRAGDLDLARRRQEPEVAAWCQALLDLTRNIDCFGAQWLAHPSAVAAIEGFLLTAFSCLLTEPGPASASASARAPADARSSAAWREQGNALPPHEAAWVVA